jgi:hypothetical protein
VTNKLGAKQFPLSVYSSVPYLTQTLTTLNLHGNQIGDKGAQYLGEALRTNTVREKESA